MKTKIFRIYLYNALINFSIVSIIQNLYFSYVGFDFTNNGVRHYELLYKFHLYGTCLNYFIDQLYNDYRLYGRNYC